MAKICATCGKGSQVGGGYSNRTRATQFNPTGKRRRQPNLQWAVLASGERAKICTRCLKAHKYALSTRSRQAPAKAPAKVA